MDTSTPDRNVGIVSTYRSADEIEVALQELAMPRPVDDDDIVVEILPAPINPSDIGAMLGNADPDTARTDRPTAPGSGVPVVARTVLTIPPDTDVDPSLVGVVRPIGQEGAGRVVAAGPGREAQSLLGRLVGVLTHGTWARWVKVPARDSVALGDGVSPAQGAAVFVNPLTALGMVESMRREDFTALVHTAAASNLGQMLHRLCRAEGIEPVNIVRSAEQVRLLRAQGAQHVVDTSSPEFFDDLVAALHITGATLAFDAIGGGALAGQMIAAMDRAAVRRGAPFPHGVQYGTTVAKKVYVYGGLDPSPIVVERRFGTAWSMGGWLLFPFLGSIGTGRAAELKRRAAADITTTFASDYARTISFADIPAPGVLQAYTRRATGEKYLLDPSA